jgi:penicillin-binding protein 1B
MYLLEYALQGVFQRGTAQTASNRLSDSLPLAGKTGNTNDLRDSWFAGYGDDLVGVVWLGNDDNSDTGLTGATGALRVWTEIMSRLDIQPRLTIPPSNVVWQSVALGPVRDASLRDCRLTTSLPFLPGRLPDPALNCEDDESLMERLFDRFRDF